ncbi:MAG: cbb3-type cytochrome c oxidase subunit 3 [Deltaproteobacteria bacterium]|nr:cbb3-type cytochrome c oxidase subunit 3 [Deltaproteobacteria bacterium]
MEEYVIYSKSFLLVYFFIIYCAILFWALRKKNKKRLEGLKDIPFLED